MDVKLLEIRDRATMIPVMAVALIERNMAEQFLLRRAGFAPENIGPAMDPVPERYVVLVMLTDCDAEYDPFSWDRHARTLPVAHQHIIRKWEEITSGDVIDVEYILGVTSEPKVSERLTSPYGV
jgi:hypothetical protein